MSDNQNKHRIVINAASNGIYYVVVIVITFFISPILVHGLGDARFGIWALVDSILAYLALADLGIGAAVLRYVARFKGLRDYDNLNKVFNTSIAIFIAAGSLALVITLGLAFLFPNPLGVVNSLVSDTRWLLILLGINLAIGLPLGLYGAVLAGLGFYPTKNIIQLSMLLVRSSLLLIVLRIGGGIPEVAVVITGCSLIEHICVAIATHYNLPNLRLSLHYANWETLRTIFGYSIFVFLVMIAGRISFQTDAIVISAFLAPEYITYFMISARLIAYGKDGILNMTAVLTPAVSSCDAVGDRSGIREVFLVGTRFVLYMALPIQIGLILLGHSFLTLWMGPIYASKGYSVLAILAAPMFVALSPGIAVRILCGIGEVRHLCYFAIGQALFNLVLSIGLINTLGINGVALGTAIPQIIYSFVVCSFTCRIVGLPLITYFLYSYSKPLLISVIPLIIWGSTIYMFSLDSWQAFVIAGVVGLTPYTFVLILIEPRLRCLLFGYLSLNPFVTKHPIAMVHATSSDDDLSGSSLENKASTTWGDEMS